MGCVKTEALFPLGTVTSAPAWHVPLSCATPVKRPHMVVMETQQSPGVELEPGFSLAQLSGGPVPWILPFWASMRGSNIM